MMFEGQLFKRIRRRIEEKRKKRALGQVIDARYEELRKKKAEEWRKMGASESLITKAFEYAEEYAIGIGSALGVDPALVYPKALDFASEWVEGIIKALYV